MCRACSLSEAVRCRLLEERVALAKLWQINFKQVKLYASSDLNGSPVGSDPATKTYQPIAQRDDSQLCLRFFAVIDVIRDLVVAGDSPRAD